MPAKITNHELARRLNQSGNRKPKHTRIRDMHKAIHAQVLGHVQDREKNGRKALGAIVNDLLDSHDDRIKLGTAEYIRRICPSVEDQDTDKVDDVTIRNFTGKQPYDPSADSGGNDENPV